MLSPDIILVRPQMQENIGGAARAMKNFTLDQMVLVQPRETMGEKATAMSSGAVDILESARITDSVSKAVKDCHYVLATTARHRDIHKPVLSLSEGIVSLLNYQKAGHQTAILFGPERTGLENSDLESADVLITVPTNPHFASLNLAQCVLLVGYQYYQSLMGDHIDFKVDFKPTQLANKEAVAYFIQTLCSHLQEQDFFYPPEKQNSMMENITALFSRCGLSEQEVGMLHGIVRALKTDTS